MRYLICFLSVVFILTSCNSWPDPDHPTEGVPTQVVDDKMQWAFALDYYFQVNQIDRNVVFSPFGLGLTFATLYLGAEGHTAKEIADVFHFNSDPHNTFLNYMQTCQSLRGVQGLNLASGLWVQEGLKPNAHFLEEVYTLPRFQFQEVNFQENASSVRYAINQWVDGSTQGKIKLLVGDKDVNEMTQLITANTMSLDARWASPFSVSDTVREEFFAYGDTSMKVQMMHQRGFFPFLRMERFSILQLPYEGLRLSLNIVLPHELDGLYGIENDFTSSEVKQWMERVSTKRVEVALPRFTIESGGNVYDELQALGLMLPFTPQADFSKISSTTDLSLSTIAQKVQIDVYEEGTSAAAATEAGMVLKTAPIADEAVEESFNADHPFFFFILDHETGAMLFVGRFEATQEMGNDKPSNS